MKTETTNKVTIRVWQALTGRWHYCDDALPYLDERGPAYPTKTACRNAAKAALTEHGAELDGWA